MAKVILTHEIAMLLVNISGDPRYKITNGGVLVNYVTYSCGLLVLNDNSGRFSYYVGDVANISVYERQDNFFG